MVWKRGNDYIAEKYSGDCPTEGCIQWDDPVDGMPASADRGPKGTPVIED